ncbi:protein of unknown function [Methylacidimicrobium sp. AP8]|nr:protein of unknown function [Methylacidimicrobium sp. AP8]
MRRKREEEVLRKKQGETFLSCPTPRQRKLRYPLPARVHLRKKPFDADRFRAQDQFRYEYSLLTGKGKFANPGSHERRASGGGETLSESTGRASAGYGRMPCRSGPDGAPGQGVRILLRGRAGNRLGLCHYQGVPRSTHLSPGRNHP